MEEKAVSIPIQFGYSGSIGRTDWRGFRHFASSNIYILLNIYDIMSLLFKYAMYTQTLRVFMLVQTYVDITYIIYLSISVKCS